MPPATILVVDDDPNLREVVRYALAREGHTVHEASDGVMGLRVFASVNPDLIVLDVLMPELDGLAMCREVRTTSQVPIIFLSTRGEEVDKVLGLDLGGDDYLPKPFSTRELVSRVHAVLRRTQRSAAQSELRVGRLRMDVQQHRAFVDDAELSLTLTEFRLLAVFLQRPGQVFTRDALTERAYPGNHHVSGRTLDSHIRRIRAKLLEHGVQALQTVHGLGFRLGTP
ncbi:MAG: two-component system OmpR family response regulator [Kiritimatiellia bacterium]|jgi:two-component system OmpR family response regulator